MDADSIIGAIFSFENYGELLVLVQNSIWAGAVLGLLGGLVGTFVMKRDLAFAVHGISRALLRRGGVCAADRRGHRVWLARSARWRRRCSWA